MTDQKTEKEVTTLTPEEIHGLTRGVSDFSARFPTRESYRSFNFSHIPFLGLVFSEEVKGLMTAINTLSTADEVAEYFRVRGIKGTRNILEDCPIANWAKSCGAKGVQVDNRGLQVDSEEYGLLNITSTAFQDFVKNFDNGNYPFLEV